jgi:hypothetical protein
LEFTDFNPAYKDRSDREMIRRRYSSGIMKMLLVSLLFAVASLTAASQSLFGPVSSELASPMPGSTFAGPNVTFTWTTGVGVTEYSLQLGTTGVGSSNLYASPTLTDPSVAVTDLPTSGEMVYARLSSMIGGAWQTADYTYTEALTSASPALTSPIPGTTLPGSNVKFSWSAATGATGYTLQLGNTGVGSKNLYMSPSLSPTSAAVTGIPESGATVYARLYWRVDGAWQSADYTYTESMPTPMVPAALTSPTPGTTLTGPSTTFRWESASGATRYVLWLGTKGVGSNNLLDSGRTTDPSVKFDGLRRNNLCAAVYFHRRKPLASRLHVHSAVGRTRDAVHACRF